MDNPAQELCELEKHIAKLRSHAKPSTELIDALNELVYRLGSVDTERAIAVAQEAQALAQLLQHHVGIATSMSRLSWLFMQAGQFDKAVREAHKALFLAEHFNDYVLISRASYVLATAHRKAGDFVKAIARWTNMLTLARAHNDRMREGDHLASLGRVYTEQGDYLRAIPLFREANDVFLQINDSAHALAKNNIAYTMALLGQSEEALPWADAALAACDPAWLVWRGMFLHTRGVIHMHLHHYDLARTELNEGYEISRSPAGDKEQAVLALRDLAKLELIHNRVTGAYDRFEQAVVLAKDIKAVRLEAEANEDLSRLYRLAHDEHSAGKYHERYLHLRSQMETDGVDKRMRLIKIEAEAAQPRPMWAQELGRPNLAV